MWLGLPWSISQHALPQPAVGDMAARDVPVPEAEPTGFEGEGEPLLAHLESLLCPALVGDRREDERCQRGNDDELLQQEKADGLPGEFPCGCEGTEAKGRAPQGDRAHGEEHQRGAANPGAERRPHQTREYKEGTELGAFGWEEDQPGERDGGDGARRKVQPPRAVAAHRPPSPPRQEQRGHHESARDVAHPPAQPDDAGGTGIHGASGCERAHANGRRDGGVREHHGAEAQHVAQPA